MKRKNTVEPAVSDKAEAVYEATEAAWAKFEAGEDLTEKELTLLVKMHSTMQRLFTIFNPSIESTLKLQSRRIKKVAES